MAGSTLKCLVALAGLAAALFASTNVDDLAVLVGFFADRAIRSRDIVIGQYAGIAALFGVGFFLALLTLTIPRTYLGLLGFFPMLMGVKRLLAWRSEAEESAKTSTARYGQIAGVALVAVANGGDNLGIYVPAFAVQTGRGMIVIALVFVAMTALWCYFAHWMVRHPRLGAPIRKYAHLIAPVVLIGLGFLILYQAGSWGWMLDLAGQKSIQSAGI